MERPPKKRGPHQQSCGSCKHRRVKCVRSNGEGEACDGCVRKGIQCSMGAVEKSTHGRTGKRIETAKALYGALSPLSTSLILSGPETRLANNEMDGTLGLELLNLYSDSSSSDPLFPPPVFDSYSLKGRFEAVGRKLSALSEEDQLTCRIVFAAASRLRPSSSTSTADPAVVSQLRISAQTHSDSQGIWRKPSASNATSLLLLSTLVGQGEIDTPEAKSYLVSLVAHLQHLYKQDPTAVSWTKHEVENEGPANGIVWSTLVYDTFSAIERQEEPIFPEREYDRLFFSRVIIELPSVASLRIAVQSDAWSAVNYLLHAVAAYVSAGRRLATFLQQSCRRTADPTAVDAAELMYIRTMLEGVCTWAGEALQLAYEGGLLDDFSVTILRLYANLSYGPSIFAQLAIVLHLESLPLRLFEPSMPYAPFSHSRVRFTAIACAFLRDIRNDDGNYLSILAGTAFSVSRLATFATLWNGTSAWVRQSHPAGPGDKLASAIFLQQALFNVSRAYPSDKLDDALRGVENEIAALSIVVGTPVPSASSYANSPATLSGSRPSISRLSTWTHLLDKEERGTTIYDAQEGADGVPPAPARSHIHTSASPVVGNSRPFVSFKLGASDDGTADVGGSAASLNGLPLLHHFSDAFPPPQQSPSYAARLPPSSIHDSLSYLSKFSSTPYDPLSYLDAATPLPPPPLDVPPSYDPLHSAISASSSRPASEPVSSAYAPTSLDPPPQHFSEDFIESFMSSLVDEAGAAGPVSGGGGEGGGFARGGLRATPLDGGWLGDENDWGSTGEEEGTTSDFVSSFPSMQPW